jgi:GT2 family glycosyltransferase
LSFVILTYGRARELRQCLESLERAGAGGRAEAWIGFNGRDADTARLEEEIPKRYPWARTVLLEKTGRAEARNLLIPKTSGELVYFLDDDAYVSEGFVERALEAFQRFPAAPVIGGPNVTPPEASPFQRAVDFLLSSPLGAGPMSVRYRREGTERPLPGWCFMLSNFGVRREVFDKHGLFFPARCSSAEENLFLFRVERKAGLPVFVPELFVYHHRRATAASFCSQVFTNGRGRAQITLAAPASLQPVVLLPPLFTLYLAAVVLLRPSPAWFIPAALYAAACLFEGLRLAFKGTDPAAALRLPPLFLAAHISYAAGLAAGVFSRRIDAGAVPGYPRDIRASELGVRADS